MKKYLMVGGVLAVVLVLRAEDTIPAGVSLAARETIEIRTETHDEVCVEDYHLSSDGQSLVSDGKSKDVVTETVQVRKLTFLWAGEERTVVDRRVLERKVAHMVRKEEWVEAPVDATPTINGVSTDRTFTLPSSQSGSWTIINQGSGTLSTTLSKGTAVTVEKP